jgi:RimJ/RimL family protein N-acetyltransferase
MESIGRQGMWRNTMIIETERLQLRQMTQEDLPALAAILQDKETMFAYEHAFSDEETQAWLDRMVEHYRNDGYGLWAVLLKSSGEMIGQCGLTKQKVEEKEVLEIGYLFQRKYWKQGFAIEAAKACKTYAFETLHADEVYSIVRDNNIGSMNVAIRNGMTIRCRFVKHYYGIDMPHYAFSIRKEEYFSE